MYTFSEANVYRNLDWFQQNVQGPQDNLKTTAGAPVCPVILRAFDKLSFHLLFHFGLFLPNVRLNVIHQY